VRRDAVDENAVIVSITGPEGAESVRTMKTIRVKVKPNARVSALEEMSDGTWLARVKSPPAVGKANDELVALIAAHFDVRKAQVSIKSGASGRLKLVQIKDRLD